MVGMVILMLAEVMATPTLLAKWQIFTPLTIVNQTMATNMNMVTIIVTLPMKRMKMGTCAQIQMILTSRPRMNVPEKLENTKLCKVCSFMFWLTLWAV
eukprot:m.15351 g.15351  ORF g.15351 m.15351 type:complete len:98 (+) comp26325_c0_seq2:935-1228(+)